MTTTHMYRFILTLHLFGVIFWIGGLLMIASLLARVPQEVGLPKERFLGAARGLFEIGTNVGAAVTVVLGVLLTALDPALLRQPWFHIKLLLIAILLFYHVRFYRLIRFLEDNPSRSSHREFSVIHGAVSLLVFAILLMAVMKPF